MSGRGGGFQTPRWGGMPQPRTFQTGRGITTRIVVANRPQETASPTSMYFGESISVQSRSRTDVA